MFDRRLRGPKELLLAPLVRFPLNRLHPDAYTILGFGFGIAASIAAWQDSFYIALGLWVVNRIFDGLDGTVARVTQRQTDLGGYIDIVLDFVVYAGIPLGISLAQDTTAAYRACALLLASFYVNAASWIYLAALLEKRDVGAIEAGKLTTITMPSGLIEGAETIVFYTLFLLFPDRAVLLFQIMAAGVLFTAAQRLVWAIRTL